MHHVREKKVPVTAQNVSKNRKAAFDACWGGLAVSQHHISNRRNIMLSSIHDFKYFIFAM